MSQKKESNLRGTVSRRDFARGAALAAAAVAALPRDILAQSSEAPPATPEAERPGQEAPKLAAASQAEAEAKIQNVLRKYGDRLNPEQRADIRRMVLQGQESLEKLRAFPLENSDEPATVLRAAVEEIHAR